MAEQIWTTWQPDPEVTDSSLPLTLVMHRTVDELNEFIAESDIRFDDDDEDHGPRGAFTQYDGRDDVEHPLAIHLGADHLHLSTIVHEATHAGLLAYGHDVLDKIPYARARNHISFHTERLPNMIGDIASMIFYWLAENGYSVSPPPSAPEASCESE